MSCQKDRASVRIDFLERTIIEDSKYYTRQIQSALVPIISTIVTGMTMGYSAVLLPQLRVNFNTPGHHETESYVVNSTATGESDITIQSIDDESWIAASAALAMAPGCWISSILMDKLGRKHSFLAINPIVLIGWLIIGLASNITSIIVGRLLCGLCVGLLGATSPVYIAETSHPRLRGLLLAALSCAVAIGILFVHVLGTWLHWRTTAYISGAIPIICIVHGIFIVESPNWLLSQGKREDGLASWTLLRGNHSIEQFQDLKSIHETSIRENESHTASIEEKIGFAKLTTLYSSWKSKFSTRIFLIPLMVVCVFSFTSQFSGINVVTFYCVQVIEEVSGPEYSYVGTLILDFVRVAFSVFACWLTRRYPRRVLAMTSGFATCFTLLSLSAFILIDFGRAWFTIGLLFIYTGTVAVGLVPLPWLLCAELFNDNNRGFGSGLSAGFAFLCFFVVVKTGPQAFNALTPAGTFAVYGTVALLGSLFLYRYLPETKDKTLRDIERNITVKTFSNQPDDKSTMTTIL